jgi:hypothetical protein
MNKDYINSIQHFINEADHKLNVLKQSRDEEFIFDYWTKSDLAQDFFKSLNKNKQNILKASKEVTLIEDARLLEWKNIFIKNKKVKRKYFIHDAGDLKTKKTATIFLGKYKIQLITPFIKDIDKHVNRTTRAIIKLQQYYPEGLIAFFHFTNTIVIIDRKEFVSFSAQNLPAISSLNYYHRDFVDHMDDLLHENGHHILNAQLRKKKLIAENDEQIFYSPWRNTLRPIRGIYHAHLTFMWALLLFKNLILNGALNDSDLTKSEKQKIIFRFLEELAMLQYSREDLEIAYKFKLVTKTGMNLVISSDYELKSALKLKTKMTKLLSEKNKLKIVKLENHLKKQRELNTI